MSLVGALTKALKAGETAKKTAPFYSAVDEALAAIKRPKGTGAEFYTELTKQAGVKKAELADRKLEQAFKAKGKITKEEAQQLLKENPPPKLQEREYNEKMVREEEDIKEELAQQMYGRSYEDLSHRDRRPIFDETQRIMGEENGPQYGDYKTQGGENYREILLKLPTSRPSASNYSDPAKYDADMKAFNASGKKDYHSRHWKEDPNVLAHMRVQDRTGPNGEKILHVEEIQSDWHQAGRKQGYARPRDEVLKEMREQNELQLKQHESKINEQKKALFDELKAIKEQLRSMPIGASNEAAQMRARELEIVKQFRALDDLPPPEPVMVKDNGVPDAPFKKNWHELAMKRLLNYAADNGYDSIAITPGAEQAKRYSLAKQLDEVQFDPNTGYLSGRDHDGKLVVAQKGVTMENLEDYIGKEGAQKILQTPVDEVGQHTLRGADLEVGGEGMKGFYDKMLPDYLNNYGKSYGAQVQMDSVPVSTRDPKSTGWDGGQGDHPFMTSQDLSEPFDGMVELLRRNPETGEHDLVGRMLRADSEARIASELMKLDTYNQIKLHNFPITKEMRESIKQKGLPLYQQIGIPTAGAGAASQMPEQMQEPELEPEVKKADGGAINYNTAPDMSDGGRIIQGAPFKRGGKVKVTTNPDAMFMELSNKKLKRK